MRQLLALSDFTLVLCGRAAAAQERRPTFLIWREDFPFEHLMDDAKLLRMEGMRGKRPVCARYLDRLPEGEFLDLERDPQQLVNTVQGPLGQLDGSEDHVRVRVEHEDAIARPIRPGLLRRRSVAKTPEPDRPEIHVGPTVR